MQEIIIKFDLDDDIVYSREKMKKITNNIMFQMYSVRPPHLKGYLPRKKVDVSKAANQMIITIYWGRSPLKDLDK